MGVDYKILFKLELLSDYFTDERSRHLRIVPAAETAAVLRDHQILWRQLGNKFILLVRVADGKPYISIDPAMVFRFYLEVENYFFLQYSSLPFDPASDQRYYFSNTNDNAVASANPVYNKIYLSKKIEAVYSNATAYVPGDLVLNNAVDKEVFEAVHPGTNKALTEPHYWYQRTAATTPRQYVHKGDLFTVLPEFPHQGILESGIIGMIEIFNNLPPASPYSFLDAVGNVKDPETKFSLRFANKLAYWRYIARTPAVINVKEKNDVFLFTPDGQKFLSTKPLPFHEKPYNIVINYQAPGSMAHVDIENIRNASYQQVRKVSVLSGETFDCSEIYLNY